MSLQAVTAQPGVIHSETSPEEPSFQGCFGGLIALIKDLWNMLFGTHNDDTGIASVCVHPIIEGDILPPERIINRIKIQNHSDRDISLIDVAIFKNGERKTVLKADQKAHASYPFVSSTRQEAPYQLEVMISHTVDCSVPLEATDSFLIEGAYRGQMRTEIIDYHRNVEAMPNIATFLDHVAKIGPLEIPASIPKPLAKRLEELNTASMHASSEEEVARQHAVHQQTILNNPNVFHALSKPITSSGVTQVAIYNNHAEIMLPGGRQITQMINFGET